MTAYTATAEGARPSGMTLAALLTGFVASTYGFGVYLFANLVVDMRRDLGFDYATVGLITGGAQVGFLAFSFVTGYLSRFCEGWKISLCSTFVTALSLLGLSISNDILLSAALLILQGGCSASAYVPLAEIVTRNFPHSKRARVMGLVASGTSYGVFINGLLVSFLMAAGGWRSIWLTAGLLSLSLCVCAYFFLRNTSAVEVTTATPKRGNAARVDRRPPGPLYLLWVLAFLNGLTLLPFQTYLAPFMRDELGMSAAETGIVWSMIGAVGMASGFLGGWIADRAGTRTALALCFITAGFGSGLVYSTDQVPVFYLAGVLFALAFYPIFGLVPTYIGHLVPVSELTRAFGIANVLIGLGGVCGNLLGGISKDIFDSFAPIYLAAGVLLLLQFLITLALPRTPS